MALHTLPANGATTAGYFSPTRDDQLRDELEDAWDSSLGRGVVSGGGVTKTAAFSVQVASGTVIVAYGVKLTLASAQTYSSIPASNTSYLWGKVTRTPAVYTGSGATLNTDSYALTLTHNTTGVEPAGPPGYVLLAVVTADGSGITSIEEWPVGKWLDSANMVQSAPDTIASGSVGVVESGRQLFINEEMTVRGELVVRGQVIVRAF
jgi:hypothetical protein